MNGLKAFIGFIPAPKVFSQASGVLLEGMYDYHVMKIARSMVVIGQTRTQLGFLKR